VSIWQNRLGEHELGGWLFSADPDHRTRLRTASLGHWFAAFTCLHGHGDVTLHRLRHTVATALVDHGKLLRAQQRLGHRDASTTLRQYCHALPMEDLEVADFLQALYAGAASAARDG
jgi:integrase